LGREARKSSLLGRFPVTVIPYGIDIDKFQPRDKRAVRDNYRIPMKARVILFVADWASEKRKGMDLLREAVQGMENDENLYFLAIGRGASTTGFGPRAIGIDYVRDDAALSLIYSTADALVVPSRQDNLPNTAIEALACGTPTIAFAVGGLPEIIRDGETGILVPEGDVGALRRAILNVSHSPGWRAHMAESCRRRALAEYTLEMQARRYVGLYQSVLTLGMG
jgi:glycosyltransferase involved in cell wall biosynthesis